MEGAHVTTVQLHNALKTHAMMISNDSFRTYRPSTKTGRNLLVDVGPVCFYSTFLLPAAPLSARSVAFASLATAGLGAFLTCKMSLQLSC